MLERNEDTGDFDAVCDECGNTDGTGYSNFDMALRHIKDSGWLITRKNNGWHNLCPDCRSERDDGGFDDLR